jgi:hypothetical protein
MAAIEQLTRRPHCGLAECVRSRGRGIANLGHCKGEAAKVAEYILAFDGKDVTAQRFGPGPGEGMA